MDRDNAVIGVTVTSRVLPGSVSRALSLIVLLAPGTLKCMLYNGYKGYGYGHQGG